MGASARETGQEPSGPIVHMTRSGVGVILSVEESCYDLLGWRPEQMVGSSSTRFIHADDQPSAIAAWVKMVDSRTAPVSGRGATNQPRERGCGSRR